MNNPRSMVVPAKPDATESAAVLWFTGLSGAGKSTIAKRVAARLRQAGHRVEELDGDVIRDIFPATGFTRPERDQHIRRVGWLEHHLSEGPMTEAASTSPMGPYGSGSLRDSLPSDLIAMLAPRVDI